MNYEGRNTPHRQLVELRVLAFSLASLVFSSWLLMGISAAEASRRVALVLVAEEYQKLRKSTVGIQRGNDIANALTAHGFDVLVNTNPSNSGARASLRDFAAKASGADLAIAVLIGHSSAWGGQSFFLPINSEIKRATDLLTRGLSVTNVAQIVGRATNGGVFVFTTTPIFSEAVEGLDYGPQFGADIAKNVFVVFSGSPKVPAPAVDGTSEQAADALIDALRQSTPTFTEAVRAVAADDTGMVVGLVPGLSLAPPQLAMVPPPAAAAGLPILEADKNEFDSKLEVERSARESAENQAREQQAIAEQAQREALKARADAEKAQVDAEKNQAEARKAQADGERILADTKKAAADAEGKLGIERAAHEAAEKRAREQQAKAEQAETAGLTAQADAKRAQADAEKTQADARRAQADAERTIADARNANRDAEGKLQAERAAREMAEKRDTELQTMAEQTQTNVLRALADARKAQAEAQRALADSQKAQTDAQGKLQAERAAREMAEKRATELQTKAERAEADVVQAQADAKRVQTEFSKALADARKIPSGVEKPKWDDKQTDDQASQPKPLLEAIIPPAPIAPAVEGQPQLVSTDHFVTGLDPFGDNWLALKSAPNLRANRLMKMPPGTPLKVLRREGAWVNIRLQDGTEGWAEAQYIGCCRASAPAE